MPSIRLERDGGPSLELASVLFASSKVEARDGLMFSYEEGLSCVHDDTTCATVDVPAKVTVLYAVEPRVVVLGAAARIAGRTSCSPSYGVVGGAIAYVAIVTPAE